MDVYFSSDAFGIMVTGYEKRWCWLCGKQTSSSLWSHCKQLLRLKPPQKKDKVNLDPSQASWCFLLGQCLLLGEAIVARKRWEEKFRRVCVMGVVAQRTVREGDGGLLLLFQKEELQTQGQGVNCIQLWSPWSFRGKCYNLLQPEVHTRFICIAKPSCTLPLLLVVFALVRSLSMMTL